MSTDEGDNNSRGGALLGSRTGIREVECIKESGMSGWMCRGIELVEE